MCVLCSMLFVMGYCLHWQPAIIATRVIFLLSYLVNKPSLSLPMAAVVSWISFEAQFSCFVTWPVGAEWDHIDEARWHICAGVLSLAALPSLLLPHVHGHRRVRSATWPRLSACLPHIRRWVCHPLLTWIIIEWWGAGVVVCLERGENLRMAQLMPLPLTISCFSKIEIGFTFLVPAHPGSPGKRAVKRVCMSVCVMTHFVFVVCRDLTWRWKLLQLHTFNGPLSGTARVSRYQKGKTNLDFTKARDSEWQWYQLGHMQVCISLQTENRASTPPLSFYRTDALPAAQPTASMHWRH